MKKAPIEPEASAGWRAALVRFDDDMRRRGAADRTRVAHGADLRQFANWASRHEIQPQDVTQRLLRRYAAALSERRAAPAAIARTVGALRAFFDTMREHGEIAADPADPIAARTLGSELRSVLSTQQISRLLDRIPASTALELRDRALFELAYSSGLRAEQLAALDLASVDFDAAELRLDGTDTVRLVPAGEPALVAVARYLKRARAALAHGGDEPALFLSRSGRRLSASDVRRRLRAWTRQATVRGGVPAHALGHASAAHLLEGGSDLRSIRQLQAHARVPTTQIRTQVESARLRTAYARAHPRA
jgi:site-specific recombinase XerD